MTVRPTDWSVVIVGRWNPGILTPQGIASRLFNLPDETPVSIQIPLDAQSPYRVMDPQHDVAVLASGARLEIQAADCEPAQLERAKEIGIHALEALPETPVTATGINCNWSVEGPSPSLARVLSSSLDEILADAQRTITSRELARGVQYGEGLVNLNVGINEDQEAQVRFNWHRKSSEPATLRRWLGQPLKPVLDFARKTLADLGVVLDMEDTDE